VTQQKFNARRGYTPMEKKEEQEGSGKMMLSFWHIPRGNIVFFPVLV
jgi:hypothetical protein